MNTIYHLLTDSESLKEPGWKASHHNPNTLLPLSQVPPLKKRFSE